MSKMPPNGPMPILDPINDGRHKLRDLPLERESIPYVIALPEQGIAAFVYTWVTKDNLAGSALAAYGPGIGDTPVFEAVDGIPMGPEKNFDNWQVGKLHLAQDLKLKTAKFGVVTDRVVIEAEYEALHPAFAYSFHPDGCPAFAATDRLEQAGKVRGTIKVDGKAIAFDTFCARDHSWGTRDWGQPQHWKWLHAYNDGTQVENRSRRPQRVARLPEPRWPVRPGRQCRGVVHHRRALPPEDHLGDHHRHPRPQGAGGRRVLRHPGDATGADLHPDRRRDALHDRRPGRRRLD